jgi:hypothetical protein
MHLISVNLVLTDIGYRIKRVECLLLVLITKCCQYIRMYIVCS